MEPDGRYQYCCCNSQLLKPRQAVFNQRPQLSVWGQTRQFGHRNRMCTGCEKWCVTKHFWTLQSHTEEAMNDESSLFGTGPLGSKRGGQHCQLPQLDGEKTINSMIVWQGAWIPDVPSIIDAVKHFANVPGHLTGCTKWCFCWYWQ